MEQPELVRKVIETLELQRLPYMVVGSFASAVYGQPRLTQDIDVVVALSVSDVDRLCAAFPSPDFYVSLLAARQASMADGQFNIIHPASGNKIDIMVARQDAWASRNFLAVAASSSSRNCPDSLPRRRTLLSASCGTITKVVPKNICATSPPFCRSVAQSLIDRILNTGLQYLVSTPPGPWF